MAISKKETTNKVFKFSPQARQAFAKEMFNFDFDFDKFLTSKNAIRRQFETVNKNTFPIIVVLEYETQESQNKYIQKFVSGTPYYSFEVATNESYWKIPYCFWAELRLQSMVEENKMYWDSVIETGRLTGTTLQERGSKKMAELSVGISEFKNSENWKSKR